MEYILINESRLKVMLDREDLAERNISAERLDYANPEARQIFGDILQYAKREFGFDTSGHRVLLQLYPSNDGGCELFISRLGDKDGKRKSSHDLRSATQKSYSFECLDHLLSVCRILKDMDCFENSSAWIDSEGVWYLTLCPDNDEEEAFMPISRFSFISEFGEPQSSKATGLYLCEYATPVCPINAVGILGEI